MNVDIVIEPARHRQPTSPSGNLGSFERAITDFDLALTPATKTALATARKLAEREAEIEADRAALRRPFELGRTVASYRDGDLHLDDVVALAVRDLVAQEPNGTIARTVARVLDGAVHHLGQQAHAALSKPGDQWLEALRPEVDRRLQVALDLVALIPPSVSDEIAARAHPDRKVYRAWLDLTEALDRLAAVHATADQWRNRGFVPVDAPVHCQDLRWLHLDRLNGDTRRPVWFFCHNVRRGAEPGLYTQAQLDAARPVEHDNAPTAA